MKITQFLTAAAFASSMGLGAHEDGGDAYKSYVAFGFNFAHGHAHDMTQKTWGGLGAFAAEFGLQFKLPSSNVQMRPNFGVAKILAGNTTEQNPDLYDLMGIYVGFDLVYAPFGHLPLSVTTGPSFHTWNVDKVGAGDEDPNQGSKGMKLGWRLGAGYEINGQFRVDLSYTLTEWRKDRDNFNFVPGFNPSRPAYFTLKASYNF
jgi:hypothetical protein